MLQESTSHKGPCIIQLHLHKISQVGKSIGAENSLVIVRGWGRNGEWEVTVNGYGFLLGEIKMF